MGDETVDFGDEVDLSTFNQILEMDDGDEEGNRDFSKSIVAGFFVQADDTFNKIQQALDSKDLEKLSSYGHFLKGSSATLGFNKIRDECEKIQQYGKLMDPSTGASLDEQACLKGISDAAKTARSSVRSVNSLMLTFYGNLDTDDAE